MVSLEEFTEEVAVWEVFLNVLDFLKVSSWCNCSSSNVSKLFKNGYGIWGGKGISGRSEK